jgi:hypothetical protein
MKHTIVTALAFSLFATGVSAENTPINGIVQSKCSIYTSVQGIYGNPTPNSLTTDAASGGVSPVIRYDVAQGDYYLAKITWPNTFSSSPVLTDALDWQGTVSVSQVSDAAMSAYETNKIEYNNVTEFDLTAAGSVWFTVASSIDYGFNKSFPSGNYASIVTAECIAK